MYVSHAKCENLLLTINKSLCSNMLGSQYYVALLRRAVLLCHPARIFLSSRQRHGTTCVARREDISIIAAGCGRMRHGKARRSSATYCEPSLSLNCLTYLHAHRTINLLRFRFTVRLLSPPFPTPTHPALLHPFSCTEGTLAVQTCV